MGKQITMKTTLLLTAILLTGLSATSQHLVISYDINSQGKPSIGIGIGNYKRDQATLHAYKDGFAINAILQTSELIHVEIQNMSVKRGSGRNSTIAGLVGIGRCGFRLSGGLILGQYSEREQRDVGLTPAGKLSYSVHLFKRD